jgi:hypothetical protein
VTWLFTLKSNSLSFEKTIDYAKMWSYAVWLDGVVP